MRKCRVRDGALVAVAHVERVNASQMRKRGIRDGVLVAAGHVECVDAPQVRKVRKRRVRDGYLVAVAHVERMDAAQVRKCCVRDGVLVAVAHVERVDARQVLKRRVCDGGLVASAHVERVNAPQVRKRRIRDSGLVATAHVERLDAPQVRKRRVLDCGLVATVHVECVDAPQVHKVSVRDGPVAVYVCRARIREARAPRQQAAADARLDVGIMLVKVAPRVLRHRLAAHAAGGAQPQHLVLPQAVEDLAADVAVAHRQDVLKQRALEAHAGGQGAEQRGTVGRRECGGRIVGGLCGRRRGSSHRIAEGRPHDGRRGYRLQGRAHVRRCRHSDARRCGRAPTAVASSAIQACSLGGRAVVVTVWRRGLIHLIHRGCVGASTR